MAATDRRGRSRLEEVRDEGTGSDRRGMTLTDPHRPGDSELRAAAASFGHAESSASETVRTTRLLGLFAAALLVAVVLAGAAGVVIGRRLQTDAQPPLDAASIREALTEYYHDGNLRGFKLNAPPTEGIANVTFFIGHMTQKAEQANVYMGYGWHVRFAQLYRKPIGP
jgi:hypothetical protein